ncbi:hypothetical protein BLA60_04480 [Actinophytocola xinjiangensis]|uniref:Subtilisin family serine protease n=1 Tax=Actinophytocola xinjiangensis TaxID=485602 RepID=A0A7Z0WS88_9PSEU|nr:hypothetical protein BLA60_04480 [Actinophytocola xinjiangensis]
MLAVVILVPVLTGAAAAEPDDRGRAPAVTVVSGPGTTAGSITLVTGDRVALETPAGQRRSVVVDAAPRTSGQEPQFEVLETGEDLYVVPSDAAPLIPGRLDRELFNVTKLAEYGYTDGVPVVVTGVAATAAASTPPGAEVTGRLPSVDGYAATVAPGGDWWSARTPAGNATSAATTGKVWLDELAEIELDTSVPMIGAPEAWSLGFDGSGQTVAVLDTGVDADHPDLAGQIVGTLNFTGDAGMADEHGHGTHVASTIAGTGAGSDGKFTGVAPGADLLIGKICDSSGSCPTSGTIAAMEWAAPLADVISMSIGTNVGDDGTAPTARAVDELSAQNPNTLFVVAAGNNGAKAGSIAAPGSADAALTVGAVDKNGKLASFSSRGPRLGDFAIKPDVTAPGVGIVAARAGGTSMGTPVDDLYTSANGTSMATPHVAGAAAIAFQHDPGLTASQVKAELIATANANPELSVYEQGGGLIDVPAAIGSPVLASPEPLDLGFFEYPQSGVPVTEKPVTYTNRGDTAVTLDLTLEVTHEDGTAAPETALSVGPTTVTVPAGGTADATVRLDVRDLPKGTYGGHLVARAGELTLRTPVGFHVEPEMADLTLTGVARDGRPATRSSSVYVLDASDPEQPWQQLYFDNGVATGRFPPGTYYVIGQLRTMDGDNRYSLDRTMIGVPTLRLDEDTTVDLDARDAKPISVDTPAHPLASPAGQPQKTVVGYGGPDQSENFAPQWLGVWTPTYLLESGPAELNDLEFVQQIRLADPALALRVVSPETRELYVQPLAGTPEIDSSTSLDLVHAGTGTEADYAGLDVAGKAVLVLRSAIPYAQIEATARSHGAAALVVMHDTSGYFFGSVGAGARIPSMAVSGEDGRRLLDQLDAGRVTVAVSGTAWSPYLYDLALTRTGALPDGIDEVARTRNLVRVDNAFHGEPGEPLGEYRALWRPYLVHSAQQYSAAKGAHRRTEYVTAGTDSLYRQAVAGQYPGEAGLQERDVTYPDVTRVRHDWFQGVHHPTVLDPAGPRNPGNPVIRDGDEITFRVAEWSDSSVTEHHGFLDTSTDTAPLKFYLDGEFVGEAPRPTVKLSNLPAGGSTVRLELATTRRAAWWQTSTRTLTNWTFRTEHAAEPELVPLLDLEYSTQLDLTNTAVPPSERPGPATLDLRVRHQAGYQGARIAGAKVWISYDDGATWQQRPTRARPGEGNFRAVLDSVAAGDTPTGHATVRVEAWDAAGNRVQQEVTRAWRLSAR